MASSQKTQKNRQPQSNKTQASAPKHESNASIELQQQCLNIFRDALKPTDDDSQILQDVKSHLYNRDFEAAFGQEPYLRVYASRWSPSRALAYLDIFETIRPYLESHQEWTGSYTLPMLCLGGGAGGELVALAAWLSAIEKNPTIPGPRKMEIDLVDIADWTNVVDSLCDAITTPPELSKYASQAKKDANKAMLDQNNMAMAFHQLDVLVTDETSLSRINEMVAKTCFITLMFTLNEIYSTSMSKTQQLLARITNTTSQDTLLLVVDSPGSYSTVSLKGTEKKYPMRWLLDYTLLGPPKKGGPEPMQWEKLIDDSSRWFRLPDGLNYPIELENMRYQIHLYRRLSNGG